MYSCEQWVGGCSWSILIAPLVLWDWYRCVCPFLLIEYEFVGWLWLCRLRCLVTLSFHLV